MEEILRYKAHRNGCHYAECKCGNEIVVKEDNVEKNGSLLTFKTEVVCDYCYRKYSYVETDNKQLQSIKTDEDNTNSGVASFIRFIGWISIVIGIIAAIISFSGMPTVNTSSIAGSALTMGYQLGVAVSIGGIISGVLLIGFAKVINLLQGIYNNTRQQR